MRFKILLGVGTLKAAYIVLNLRSDPIKVAILGGVA
jgi:hypothetical protein